MSFSRSKNETLEKRQWAAFCKDNAIIIESSGLPSEYVLDEAYFIDFLMHGYIDHHRDIIRFTDGVMSQDQRRAFLDLLRAYFSAGHEDPGIVCLSEDELAELERDFPDSFAWRR